MSPLISVVVPVYGVEKYLRQCVDSILAQTYGNLEVILVDDGSKDGCPQIIDEYAAKDNRIKAIHQSNGGYSAAMNNGLDVAAGEWIGIVEPDDWIEPEMYETLITKAVETGADIAKSDFNQIVDERKTGAYLVRYMKAAPLDLGSAEESAQLIGEHASIWTAVYRRSMIEEHRIRFVPAPGAAWTDVPFQIETLLVARKIAWIDSPLYNYRFFASGGIKNLQIVFDRANDVLNLLERYSAGENFRGFCYHRILRNMRAVPLQTDPWKIKRQWAGSARAVASRMDVSVLNDNKHVQPEDRKDALWYAKHPMLRFIKYSLKVWVWKQTKGRIIGSR